MTVLSAVAVVTIGSLGWLTTRSITHSTKKLLDRVQEMAGGAGIAGPEWVRSGKNA